MRKPKTITLVILFSIITIAAFFTISCGMYHDADIAGYVRDSASGYGINGAVLKVYLTEEAADEAEGHITETSSMVYNGNYGYFNYKIIWQKLFSSYGSEGDATDIWITAEHEDYASKTVQVRGINSNAMNVIPDIQMDAVVYTAQQVSGLIVKGVNPQNGVRVELDLASTDANPDYIAVSSTVDLGGGTMQAGMYTFVNVKWRDENNPGQTADEEVITISVNDDVYTGDKTIERSITSGLGLMMLEATDTDNIIVVTN